LIQAYLLDGRGGATRTDAGGVERWKPSRGAVWVHMDLSVHAAAGWLSEAADLDPWVVEALTDPGSRPRVVAHDGGVLVVLRGPNLNPGANPARMIPLAVWADEHRLITLRMHAMRSITAMRERLEAGQGPTDPAGSLRFLLDQLEERATAVVGELGEVLEGLAEIESARPSDFERLTRLRRDATQMRRFLVPQRDAVRALGEKARAMDSLGWFGRAGVASIGESADAYARLADEIDALREEASLIHEEWTGQMAQRTNQRLYLLAVLTAIFLPLTLVTGMLGMNVAGVPLAEWGGGFWAVTVGLVAAAIVGLGVARALSWI
jgi:zinc transporter